MRPILAAIAGLALLGLAGCESAPTYEAQTSPHSPGYADKQLAENRWRVSYNGGSSADRAVVEDFLLRRAAEVTLKAGYPAFMFDTRDTKTRTRYFTDFAGWPGWRGYGWYWHSWGDEVPTETWSVTHYNAYAEIVLLKDDEAKKEPRALRAQDVLDHLGPAPASKP